MQLYQCERVGCDKNDLKVIFYRDSVKYTILPLHFISINEK